jgi:hypothetical protein
VPVFDLATGGDMVTLDAHHTRQPASDSYRRWELAGAAHAEESRWVVAPGDELPMGPGCDVPINTAPHDAFVKAGLRRLTDWVGTGAVTLQSPDIELRDAEVADPIRRDQHGNAVGGVRLPQVEAPTATLDGLRNVVADGGPGGLNFCRLFGHTMPFDAETLGALHPNHAAFVERFVTAVDALEQAGYLLAPEAETARVQPGPRRSGADRRGRRCCSSQLDNARSSEFHSHDTDHGGRLALEGICSGQFHCV